MDPSALRPAELARHREFLCRLARGLLGDAARAEDVVQDAFVLALERPPEEGSALPAWLGRVVQRLSLNERRRSRRARAHELAAARPAAQDSHADAAAHLDAQHFVLGAVRALAEPYKTAIWLRYYEDLAPSVIAARQGVPVKTVKTRLARALGQLRGELERSSGGDRASWAALLLPLAGRGSLTPVVASGTGTLAGMLAMKKLALALGVLAFLLLTWRVLDPGRPTVADGGGVVEVGRNNESAVGAAVAAEARTDRAREAVVGRENSGREDASAGATLVVHATWERDGTDASGIGLVLVPEDLPRPDLVTGRAATDASGQARFEGLVPGGFALHSDREGNERIELAAGETRELELLIGAGVDVAGTVVDRDGQAVAAAEIWLSRRLGGGWLGGSVVARADASGRFFLRSVDPRQSVGAFASGFAPAWLEALSAKSWPAEDPRVELTLVLERAGAALEGRVLDPEGIPVPGALVGLGGAGIGMAPRADGRWGTSPSPRTVVTDDLGRFHADWLEPGTLPVFVLAEGFALARVDATLAAGTTELVTVQLTRGVTIAGCVRDSSGQPLFRASVRVQGGEVYGACPFSTLETKSAADGSFVLESVSAGEITLLARHATDEHLRARSTRFVAEGVTESWDLVLEAAPHISGRAVDSAGRALAHWKVTAHASLGGMSASRGLETDDEGRFVVLVMDPAQAWTLELARNDVVHDRAANAHAGDEVVLVGRRDEELGRVAGGFADSASRAPAGERITVGLLEEGSGLSPAPSAELVAERFAFEGVSPGRYRVRVRTADFRLAESDAFELAPGASVDVGLLASRPAGALVVEFQVPAGIALPDEGASIEGRPIVRSDGTWRVEGLDAGHHALSTDFPGLAKQVRGFDVEEGRETHLSVTLERGVERTLVFVPGPGVLCRWADVRVRAADWELSWPASGTQRLEATLTLAPGSYEVEATADAGVSARGTLVIADLSLEHAEIVFDLR